jgi:cytochrome c-type biogenesis protein CcmH
LKEVASSQMQKTIPELKLDLKKVKELHQTGALGDESYMEAVAKIEREILHAVVSGDDAPISVEASKSSNMPLVALAGLVIAVAAVGYGLKLQGRQDLSQPTPVSSSASGGAQNEQHSEGAQLEKMSSSLAAKLKDAPDNVDGWVMLSRTYVVMGKNSDALSAMENAYSLQKSNPEIMAALAEVKAINNANSYEGEPIKLVEKALSIDPHCRLALYLAGDYAFEKKNYTKAVKLLEEFASTGPQDSARTKKAWMTADQARVAAGMPAKSRAVTQDTSSGTQAPSSFKLPAEGGVQVRDASKVIGGVVTVSPSLASKVSPEDTLYVFARDANGSKMPLAIVSRKGKDLPFSFQLDDSTSMAPASKLSGAKKIIVGARISKSGNPIPQPGDLSGFSKESDLGKSDLKVEISEMVK